MAESGIDSVLKEARVFDPPEAFSETAHIKNIAQYERMYREASEDPEKFWGRIADELHWFKPWDRCWNGMHPGRNGFREG